MRHPVRLWICAAAALALTACEKGIDREEVDRALQDINVVDESNLNEVMLTVADPDEAVAYFKRASTQQPDRIDLRRGLAQSLIRAGRTTEAVSAWTKVTEHADSTNEDKVALAGALIRNNAWDRADALLDSVPPTYETYQRYRLEAMIADSNKEWKKADSFYETAVGLTTQPAKVMNNWGYSKLSRGDFPAAERLFTDAIRSDRTLFTAKNNLVLARGAQKKYALPVVPTTQSERAQLLYTLGLSAAKQGDTSIARGLFRDAVETHPQYFEEAARSLRALEDNVTN